MGQKQYRIPLGQFYQKLTLLWSGNIYIIWLIKQNSHPFQKTNAMSCFQNTSLDFLWRELMTWRLEDSRHTMNNTHSNRNRGYIHKDSWHESNQSAYQLLAFKKSINREVSQYTTLKDEKYFEAFKRYVLVTATTHDCEDILDGSYKLANNNDSKELVKQKK